jgi:hypothetical protein
MPSATPSASFEFEKITLNVTGVVMNLKSGGSRRILQASDSNVNCTKVWQDDVRDRIIGEVKKVIPRFEMLRVLISNVSSSESAPNVLSILFNVLIEIRSPVQDHSVNRYLEGPFDTEAEQRSFAEVLRSSGCPEFRGVTSVEMVVPKTAQQASPERRGISSAGLIAGLVMATASIILVGAAFIFVRIRNKGGLYDDEEDPVLLVENQKNQTERFDYASEIDGVHTNTDISTLGDPIPAGASRNNDGDQSTIGSVSLEYDFKKAFMDAQSVTDSQLADASVEGAPFVSAVATLDDPSLTSDIITTVDDIYGSPFGGEDQFDVVAPAGLLGLILESSAEDGRPTVNVIKPTSVLAHVVHIGDRVVSVDGQNVSTMRASDVSRLIASKKDKPRVIAFSRQSALTTFRIEEDCNEDEK